MKLSVRPALPTAPVVRGLDMDHDLRRGQRCTVLNRPVSLINRGKPVQINRATSNLLALKKVRCCELAKNTSRLFMLFGLANPMIAGRQLGMTHSRIASCMKQGARGIASCNPQP